MTLVELLVVLVLLGVVAGLSAMSVGNTRASRLPANADATRVSAARAEAIRTGRPVQLHLESGEPVLLLPDGRAIGGGVDPFAGVPTDAR